MAKRGRPKGSKNKRSPYASVPTQRGLGGTKRKRGRPKGSKNKTTKAQVAAMVDAIAATVRTGMPVPKRRGRPPISGQFDPMTGLRLAKKLSSAQLAAMYPAIPKKRRGRPKGSKNKTTGTVYPRGYRIPKGHGTGPISHRRIAQMFEGAGRPKTKLTAADLRKLDIAMGITPKRGRPKLPAWMRSGKATKAPKKSKHAARKPRHEKVSLAKRYGGNPHKPPGHVPVNILIGRYEKLTKLINSRAGKTPQANWKPLSLLRERQAELAQKLGHRL